MSSESYTPAASDARQADTVAGFLAAMAIAADLIGLAWHPLRLIGPGIIVSMIAAGMGSRGHRLARAAVFCSVVCFFLGMMISVVTQRPLW